MKSATTRYNASLQTRGNSLGGGAGEGSAQLVPCPSAQQAYQFEAILSALEDFVYVFDRDGRFTYVNRPLLDLWGKTLPEVIGKGFEDLDYPPSSLNCIGNRLRRLPRRPLAARGEPLYQS